MKPIPSLAKLVPSLLVAGSLSVVGCRSADPMPTTVTPWGAVDGQPVALFTLRNANGLLARVSEYGAALVELHVPDRDGVLADVVLGHDDLAGYVADGSYFGVTVGRVANRIAGASFELDGERYELDANNGRHHLHGGPTGLSKRVWHGQLLATSAGPAVRLTCVSPDGDGGYPGELSVEVTYTLTDADELIVDMRARSDRRTPVNLAHHSYWNLGGHDGGDVLDHSLQLDAARYTPTDAELIPTGEIAPVTGTPFDFTAGKALGADLALLPRLGPDDPGGYDVNFVVDGQPGQLRAVALVVDPASGRSLTLFADAPGVQLYTGNFLDGSQGKGGASYGQHHAFCLETQHFPDAVHHEDTPGWPSVVLAPGSEYGHRMVHAFGIR